MVKSGSSTRGCFKVFAEVEEEEWKRKKHWDQPLKLKVTAYTSTLSCPITYQHNKPKKAARDRSLVGLWKTLVWVTWLTCLTRLTLVTTSSDLSVCTWFGFDHKQPSTVLSLFLSFPYIQEKTRDWLTGTRSRPDPNADYITLVM